MKGLYGTSNIFFFVVSTKWVAQLLEKESCSFKQHVQKGRAKQRDRKREWKKQRQNQVTMTEQKKYIFLSFLFSLEIWKLVSVWIILANAIWLLLFGIAIKVTSVAIATNLRYIGCSDLPSKYTTKVNSFKPSVSLDIITSSTQVTKTLRQIRRQ